MPESKKIKPDFFTETKLSLTLLQQEFEIRMGVWGFIEIVNNQVSPKIFRYKILEIKKQNKIIKVSEELFDNVSNWIKNNPQKFNMVVIKELHMMTLLTDTPPENNLAA